MRVAPGGAGETGHWAGRFAENLDRFTDAAQRTGGIVERCFSVGGYLVVLRFAGPALVEPMTRALSHLACSDAPDAHGRKLTVLLWDEASTGVRAAGLRPGTESASMELFRSRATVGLHQPVERILSVLDRRSDTAVWWTPDAQALPYWERGAPLLRVLHWWMSEHGRQVVHGATVGTGDGGVLLVGPGGSGKSSTALASLQSGLRYVGDDYVLVEVGPPVVSHSLYNSAKLHPGQAERFPSLLGQARAQNEEKVLAFMDECLPDRMVSSLPLLAVMVPKVVGTTRTTFEPMSRAQGLSAVAPSTILQLQGAGEGTLTTLASLLRAVPCYRLALGTDLGEIPKVLRGLIEDLRR
jgi:hypothetical protein